ncbi:carbon-nitrogen hydrolase family protein [Streptomyces sp. ISL-100]|uniref:carbon-nitrogen hydrolase family protein n=1 Tax=Streptomyces sp. ISL-100 TaxID=2819173 RepID=UPI001BEA3CF9|nr:carbon-nitrogen hydrolase family protein [Streptomyces sp. ISL-100]MBT2398792.1 carbon-nitrogen hydrolase family protein [Streptomyces sp. ISL-100]
MLVAAAQFTSEPGSVDANARRMAAYVREAAGRGARVTVFAELALTGYELELLTPGSSLLVTPGDPRLEPVLAACRETATAAVINCAARSADGGERPTIASFVFGPDGGLLTRYDKQHLYEQEREVFTPGAGDGRFELDGVRFALATCFDNHFPEVAERAAEDKCRAYLASSLYWRGNGERERLAVYPSRARDHGLYVVLANHVGPAGPNDGCGLSAVWGPDGTVLAEAAPGEAGLVLADVPMP